MVSDMMARRAAATVLAVGMFLSACGSSLEPAAPTHITFAADMVLNVDATSVYVEFASASPREYPHVGYRSPVTFEDAVKNWVDSRFELTGKTVNALRVTVKEADITEELLPVKTGFTGAFKKEQAAKYEAKLEVRLQIVDPIGKVVASASSEAWNTHTVPEDATETDKQIVWVEMVKKAFDSLDQGLIPQVRQSMRAYVR